jgi:hypothetical protein
MSTIGDLPVATSVCSDDKLPIWSNANGCTRALPISVFDSRYLTQAEVGLLAASPIVETFSAGTDFTPGTTTFVTLANQYYSVANIEVFFDASYQGPDQYSLIGYGLTFISPIPVGVQKVYVRGGQTRIVSAPSAGTVTDASLAPGSNVAKAAALAVLTVTPELFGAVGDWNGTTGTDNTIAFSLMNAYLLANSGGRVSMAGKYYVPNGWILPCGNIEIDGHGVAEVHSLGSVSPTLSATSFNKITVRGLRCTVPLTNLRSGQINIFFTFCNFVRVYDCSTQGGQAGIWFFTCNDIMVEGCHIDTPKADGIHFGQGSSRCKAIGNTVLNSGDDAFSTTYYAGEPRPSEITFANNIVVGTLWGCGVSAYDADNVVIVGNNIRNTALAGINLGANGGPGCTNVEVTGNKQYGTNLAETQPNSYWFGTDPALDPPVTAISFESGMYIQGTNLSIRSNLISNASSYPNGFVRLGMSLGGGAKIVIADNTFIDINGLGIDTGGALVNALTISGNTFDYVHDTAIWARCPVTTTMSITNNTDGYGAFSTKYVAKIQNAGSTRVIVTGNTSSIGKGIFTDGTSTNVLNTGNYS